MADRRRSITSCEHRDSVGRSNRLSVDEDGYDGLPVVVSPSLDSADVATTNDSPPSSSDPTPVADGGLLRFNSVHSRPSSIAKPVGQGPPQSQHGGAPSEGCSSENLSVFMPPEAPYEGPSNPSHPYQMYPQRAMSISTISVVTPGPDGSYSGSRGPAHPYGLYPQSTSMGDVTQPETIPVGFPGSTNSLPRRAVPGVDDANSFVGSLAHSEALPPYTRYPENGLGPKAVGSPPTSNDPSSRESRLGFVPHAAPSSNMGAIPGAGGIGLATRDPEFASTSSEPGSPRLSTRSFISDESHHEINTAVHATESEKPTRTSWKQQATRKLWGIIPYWAVGLLGVALILMGIILGAVIGTFVTKDSQSPRRGRPDHNRPIGDANATQEVILLKTVPPDLPDLEIGEWGLLPLTVNQAPNTCFEIPDQSQAWTCNAPISLYWVHVQSMDDGPPTAAYQLKLAPSKDSTAFTKYAWGGRTPAIPEHEKLRLVRDPFEPGLGPAWWVRMAYNKTVVLPGDRISRSGAASDHARRDFYPDADSESDEEETDGEGEEGQDAEDDFDGDERDDDKPGKPSQVPGAKEGDKPWICTWPDTILEVFVYPRQNNTYSSHSSAVSFSGFPYFPTPTDSPTFSDGNFDGGTKLTEAFGTAAAGSSNPTGGKSGSGWSKQKYPPLPPPYPKIIRVSERRMVGLPDALAYCEKVEIIDGGKDHRPVVDAKGRAIRVPIPEQTGRQHSLDRKEVWAGAGELVGRDKPPGECGCVWMAE